MIHDNEVFRQSGVTEHPECVQSGVTEHPECNQSTHKSTHNPRTNPPTTAGGRSHPNDFKSYGLRWGTRRAPFGRMPLLGSGQLRYAQTARVLTPSGVFGLRPCSGRVVGALRPRPLSSVRRSQRCAGVGRLGGVLSSAPALRGCAGTQAFCMSIRVHSRCLLLFSSRCATRPDGCLWWWVALPFNRLKFSRKNML